MERFETEQPDPLGETARIMADFRARVWEPERPDRGLWIVAVTMTVIATCAGIAWLVH